MELTSLIGVTKNCFNTIGRMYAVSPTQTELFHLRLLVDGVIHNQFAVACLAKGLIDDNN